MQLKLPQANSKYPLFKTIGIFIDNVTPKFFYSDGYRYSFKKIYRCLITGNHPADL